MIVDDHVSALALETTWWGCRNTGAVPMSAAEEAFARAVLCCAAVLTAGDPRPPGSSHRSVVSYNPPVATTRSEGGLERATCINHVHPETTLLGEARGGPVEAAMSDGVDVRSLRTRRAVRGREGWGVPVPHFGVRLLLGFGDGAEVWGRSIRHRRQGRSRFHGDGRTYRSFAKDKRRDPHGTTPQAA